MTTEQLLRLAVISISIGIALGVLFVVFIQLKRRNTVINSLVNGQKIVGLTGVVEIPFDQDSKGKIRVNFQGSTRNFTALTHFPYQFSLGEKVMIIEVQGNKVWIIPEDQLRSIKA